MNLREYKRDIKKELLKFDCVLHCWAWGNKKDLYCIVFDDKRDTSIFYEFLVDNKDRFGFKNCDEYGDKRVFVTLLNLDKFVQKSELDLEIENLENKLKDLKQKRNIERLRNNKLEKINKLKEEINSILKEVDK